MSLEEILNSVMQYETAYITVTGGEPLAQPNCVELLQLFCDRGYQVSLETSGAIDIAPVDRRVSRVMDLKTPGSGEQGCNFLENLNQLTSHDQLKFVICDRNDYLWAKEMIIRCELAGRCEVLISPSYGQINPGELAEWVLEDRLPVRFQLQLHKLLWGDEPGR